MECGAITNRFVEPVEGLFRSRWENERPSLGAEQVAEKGLYTSEKHEKHTSLVSLNERQFR